MSDYRTLRTWAMQLMIIGAIIVISAGVGVLSLAIAVDFRASRRRCADGRRGRRVTSA